VSVKKSFEEKNFGVDLRIPRLVSELLRQRLGTLPDGGFDLLAFAGKEFSERNAENNVVAETGPEVRAAAQTLISAHLGSDSDSKKKSQVILREMVAFPIGLEIVG
jgi:hypothetical protein